MIGEQKKSSTHLFESTLGLDHVVHGVGGDPHHGGEADADPDALRPHRVLVRLAVGQRLVLHHVEDEDRLRTMQNTDAEPIAAFSSLVFEVFSLVVRCP